VPVVKWAISNIVLPKKWNRQEMQKNDLAELTASIRARGQLVPLQVRMTDKPTKVELVEGRRRLAVLQDLGQSHALVSIVNAKDDIEAFLLSLVTNLNRKNNTSYEIAEGFGFLVEAGMSSEEIAKSCGKTPGYVSQHLAVLKADQRLQMALQKGKVNVSLFRYFTKLDREDDKDKKFYDKMVDLVLKGNVTAQDIGEKIGVYKDKQAATDKSKKTKPKKKAGPKVKVLDYSDPVITKNARPVSKDKALKYLEHYAKVVESTSLKTKREYYRGVLLGLELSVGLAEED